MDANEHNCASFAVLVLETGKWRFHLFAMHKGERSAQIGLFELSVGGRAGALISFTSELRECEEYLNFYLDIFWSGLWRRKI